MEVGLHWKLAAAFGTVLIGILVTYCVWLKQMKNRAEKLCSHFVHTVQGLPIIGSAWDWLRLKSSENVWNYIMNYSITYKEGVFLWLFHIPWHFVTDLDVVERVLTSSESTEKSHIYQLLDPITDGVFIAPGIRWKKLRKKCNLTFAPKQLDLLYNDMNEALPITVDILNKNTGKHINIMSFISTYFTDVVCRSHFGVATNEQRERKEQVAEFAAKVVEFVVSRRMFKPLYHSNLIFSLTRCYQYIITARCNRVEFIRKMIRQRLANAEEEKASGVYEDTKRVYYVDRVKEALEELNIEPSVYNIERNTGDMLIAASDTTSVAVCAALYYLAIFPEIQEKVYQEALTIFGENSTKDLTKDDINKMVYLDMVIKETLRNTAPPGVIRELANDLDVGKYIIPRRTNVYITFNAIHRNPEYYEKPYEFNPEHFTPEAVKNRPKMAFIPFSHGPRNCPGTAYSYITMKGVISTMVRNFKLESNIPLKDVKFKMVLMQEHANGYFIKLTPR